MRDKLHRSLTQCVVSLGPDNLIVRSAFRFFFKNSGFRLSCGPEAWDITKSSRTIRINKNHFVYAMDLAKHFDSYFDEVVAESQNGREVVDFSRPRLQTYRQSGLSFELSSIPEEQAALESYFRWYQPKDGDLVFDIGAYCGVSAVCLSQAVGSGKVIAFEPDPQNFELLVRNLERHSAKNVVPIQLAVSDSAGMATFGAEGALGSGLKKFMSRASTGVSTQVPTVTLEDAVRRFGAPAFVKMDIEGAEIGVLEAAKPFLAGSSIQFALDTNHWNAGHLTNDPVEQIFKSCGYDVQSSDATGFMTTWARPRLAVPV